MELALCLPVVCLLLLVVVQVGLVVRDQVLTDYRNDAARRLTSETETFLRRRANVLVAEDLKR